MNSFPSDRDLITLPKQVAFFPRLLILLFRKPFRKHSANVRATSAVTPAASRVSGGGGAFFAPLQICHSKFAADYVLSSARA